MQDQILETKKTPVAQILNNMKVSTREKALLIPEGQIGTYRVAMSNIQSLTSKIFNTKTTDKGTVIWRTE